MDFSNIKLISNSIKLLKSPIWKFFSKIKIPFLKFYFNLKKKKKQLSLGLNIKWN